jgi:glutamine amidotransferase
MTNVTHVVDYGVGNLYSVARAIEKVGGIPRLTNNLAEIAAADRLVLPGVGAFPDGMRGLCDADLDSAVVDFAKMGRPLLGICLGMQMLASSSLEFGMHRGLGLIPGKVEPIPTASADGLSHKVPFIGWTELLPVREKGFENTLLSSIKPQNAVYLVHSYHFLPEDPDDLLATYDYDGVSITAAVTRDNIMGCQFHPEKSGSVGLNIIRHFIEKF